MDDDGFQDFLSEDEEECALQTQESAAMERRMRSLGIRDGLEFGKEDTLQQGFDAGFAAGATRSHRFGVLRGALSAALLCGLFDGHSDVDKAAVKAMAATLRALSMQTAIGSPSEPLEETLPAALGPPSESHEGASEGSSTAQATDEQAAEAALADALRLLESVHVQVPDL